MIGFTNKSVFGLILLALAITGCKEKPSSEKPAGPAERLLIFSKTDGYRHESIEEGAAALRKLATEKGWVADHSEDAALFTDSTLARYKAVIFLSTTKNILNEEQQGAFERYINNGGGFVGIHAAADTEYGWPWYGKLVGAYFESHPQIQEAVQNVVRNDHPSTSFLPERWRRTDEWYNFKDINPGVTVLLMLDESSYEGGTNGEFHPAAWFHEFDGGRAFYTAGGHTAESYAEELFLQHVWGGIEYVVGK